MSRNKLAVLSILKWIWICMMMTAYCVRKVSFRTTVNLGQFKPLIIINQISLYRIAYIHFIIYTLYPLCLSYYIIYVDHPKNYITFDKAQCLVKIIALYYKG